MSPKLFRLDIMGAVITTNGSKMLAKAQQGLKIKSFAFKKTLPLSGRSVVMLF